MEVFVEYGELSFNLPRSPYRIQVTNDRSEVTSPDFIQWSSSQNQGVTTVRKGYSKQKDSGRSIVINAAYSNVDLKD
ncbi:MAG: hypothetical protein EP302_00325 [Bacteroidetes bacterium]|nr:MAG: hypothetical protein EP302_00325 [Bacteroidota bacterium]